MASAQRWLQARAVVRRRALRTRTGALARIAVLLCLFCAGALRPAPASAQTTSTIPLATRVELRSKILGGERTIEVALPDGYEKEDAHYPVLYVLDGLQNLRHVAGSADVLTRTGQIPPLIIVGIETDNRMRDFTPSESADVPYSGGAPKFLRFVRSELIPYVDSHYRTHPFRVLEGHSLGGLFTGYTLVEHPDLFDAYIVMSPAFWWNHEEMTKKAKTVFAEPRTWNESVFFGIGGDDGQGMQNELGRFVDVLKGEKPKGLEWKHRVFPGEGHMSAPLLTNYYGMKFVFSDMGLPESFATHYDDATFRAHEAQIVKKYGKAARESEQTYVTLGLELMKEKNYEGAVTVLERNVEAYPVYPPNYAWLAQAYEGDGQLEKALATYREALKRSRAIHYGQEEEYESQIERLEGLISNDR